MTIVTKSFIFFHRLTQEKKEILKKLDFTYTKMAIPPLQELNLPNHLPHYFLA